MYFRRPGIEVEESLDGTKIDASEASEKQREERGAQFEEIGPEAETKLPVKPFPGIVSVYK